MCLQMEELRWYEIRKYIHGKYLARKSINPGSGRSCSEMVPVGVHKKDGGLMSDEKVCVSVNEGRVRKK